MVLGNCFYGFLLRRSSVNEKREPLKFMGRGACLMLFMCPFRERYLGACRCCVGYERRSLCNFSSGLFFFFFSLYNRGGVHKESKHYGRHCFEE